MNIIVCVKQVPRTDGVRLKAGAEFSAEGLPRRLNLFDAFAIEAAARIKDDMPDTSIILVSLDENDAAKRALVEGLSIAADSAYLVCDKSYGGCDSVASARILAAAIREIEAVEGPADLILAGKQSTDSGCGTMVEMLSELLGRKSIHSVSELRTVAGGHVEATVRGGNGFSSADEALPCVVSLTKPAYEVRLATFKRIREANRAQITVLDSSVLGKFSTATKLVKVIKPGRNSKNSIIHEEDEASSAELLISMLEEDKIFAR